MGLLVVGPTGGLATKVLRKPIPILLDSPMLWTSMSILELYILLTAAYFTKAGTPPLHPFKFNNLINQIDLVLPKSPIC